MKGIIKIMLVLITLSTAHSKEWVIKLHLNDVKLLSNSGLKHPSWFVSKYKVKNMINLSFFTHKTFVPPYKDIIRFKPNNPLLWPFVSIDYANKLGVPNINPHLHFNRHTDVPAIWSKYIFAGTPLIVKDSIPQKIPNNKFTLAKRPRTVFGSHHPDSVFIYINSSIRIVDMPKRLLELGCKDAMNCDGGGSTFLYQNSEYVYVQSAIKNMRKYPNILTW